jgi:hypothetical protein
MKIPLGNADEGFGGTVLMLSVDEGVLFHVGGPAEQRRSLL